MTPRAWPMRMAVRGNLYSAYRSSTTRNAGACASMTWSMARWMAFNRASSDWVAPVEITPTSRTVTAPGAASRTAKPVATSPGSTPITRKPLGRGDGVEDLVGDVVVGIDGLDVVLLLERLDEPQHGRGILALHPHGGLGHHGDLRLDDREPLRLERVPHGVHFIRRGRDLENFFDGADVRGAALERLLHHLVFLGLLGVHLDEPAAVEHPRHAACRPHPPALLLEDVPDLRPRPVLVVGENPHEHRHASRAVTLVGDLLELLARQAARAFLDGALDVVGRHIGRSRRLHRGLEAQVALGIAAPVLGRYRDLAEDLREELSPLVVCLALLALDLGPP